MHDIKFRALRADEVECRVGTCSKTGVTLLLYKDARCDMQLLDETCTPLGWKREHSRDNANCTVSIWDESKNQWVSKEDTGTVSNTEAEKGLASDSFKRACVNWGIGRELYTAPFIRIGAGACAIRDSGRKNKYGEPIYTCDTRFKVSKLESKDGCIVALAIINEYTGALVFSWEKDAKKPVKKQAKKEPAPVKSEDPRETAINRFNAALEWYCKREGKNPAGICRVLEQRNDNKPVEQWEIQTLEEYAQQFDAAVRG